MRLLKLLLVVLCSITKAPIPSALAQRRQEIETLNKQILSLYKEGNYKQLIPIAVKLLKVREESLGPAHPDTATSLDDLALLYQAIREYAKAEPLYQRALRIREKAFGPDHPDVTTSLLISSGVVDWSIHERL